MRPARQRPLNPPKPTDARSAWQGLGALAPHTLTPLSTLFRGLSLAVWALLRRKDTGLSFEGFANFIASKGKSESGAGLALPGDPSRPSRWAGAHL